MQRVETQPVLDSLEKMILDGASVNFYMFYGGTNFGFTAGANDGGPGSYNSDVTSYDYDAPMDEAGEPTEKYFAIRRLISKYFPLPNVPVPDRLPKVKLPTVTLKPQTTLLDSLGRRHLAHFTKKATFPESFEVLDQNSGFILYETTLPKTSRDPGLLKFADLKDRAYVYVNRQFAGILSRENKIYSLPLTLSLGRNIQIVVENEGRINYGIANDFKGILGNVYFDSIVLVNWTMTGYPLDDYQKIEDLTDAVMKKHGQRPVSGKAMVKTGPGVFHAEFNLTDDQVADTYMDSTGWGKGVVFINGFNLGRYWPLVGPQITIYVPKEVLKSGLNKIVMIELQMAPENGQVSFTDTPNLDGNF